MTRQYHKSDLAPFIALALMAITPFAQAEDLCGLRFREPGTGYQISIDCTASQTARVVQNNQGLLETQVFDKNDAGVFGFNIFDSQNKVTRSYRSDTYPKSISELYLGKGYSQEEASRREQIANSDRPIHIGMIDSGVDLANEEIAYKFNRNLADPIDGIDNDGNGFVDDYFGLSYSKFTGAREFNIPSFEIALARSSGDDIFSHSTHVASLLLHGHEDVALTAYSFPDSLKDLDKVKAYLATVAAHAKQNKIRVMNMSIGTPEPIGGPPPIVAAADAAYKKARSAAADLIQSTPDTLFVVAAGNGYQGSGIDLSETKYPTLPAALDLDNILVVGSFNASRMNEKPFSDIRMSGFSNFSEVHVDILSPGEKVPGAQLGGGTILKTGTSMATPNLINLVIIPLLRERPSLTATQLKEITLKTATLDWDRLFPVRSGGIVNPARALAVAKMLNAHSQYSVASAVTAVMRTEGQPPAEIKRRQDFWLARKI